MTWKLQLLRPISSLACPLIENALRLLFSGALLPVVDGILISRAKIIRHSMRCFSETTFFLEHVSLEQVRCSFWLDIDFQDGNPHCVRKVFGHGRDDACASKQLAGASCQDNRCVGAWHWEWLVDEPSIPSCLVQKGSGHQKSSKRSIQPGFPWFEFVGGDA